MAIINGTIGNDTLDDLYRRPVFDVGVVENTGTVGLSRSTSLGSATFTTSATILVNPFAPVDRGTDDTINALEGHDSISIHNGNDTVYGGYGSDVVFDRGIGNDTFYGEIGNDYFVAGKGNDTFNGGEGTDRVSYELSEQIVALDLQTGFAISEGIDTLVSVEDARGGIGNDTLLGSSVANFLIGGDGNDRLDGRGHDDRLDGGQGNDTLIGGTGQDSLLGGVGNDTLKGDQDRSYPSYDRYPNDVLTGGQGNDVMIGGRGADKFAFTSRSDFDNYDTITDFQHGADKIDLRSIDARPDQSGDQAFRFDSTPDGRAEEAIDALDDWGAWIFNGAGPVIHGDTGEIEYRHSGGKTYVYLSYGDTPTDSHLVLNGTINLTASDFLL